MWTKRQRLIKQKTARIKAKLLGKAIAQKKASTNKSMDDLYVIGIMELFQQFFAAAAIPDNARWVGDTIEGRLSKKGDNQ
jgi:hypothetical protein